VREIRRTRPTTIGRCFADRLALEQSNATARRLLGASTADLPLLLIALLFDGI
jgi:hypothetical protein